MPEGNPLGSGAEPDRWRRNTKYGSGKQTCSGLHQEGARGNISQQRVLGWPHGRPGADLLAWADPILHLSHGPQPARGWSRKRVPGHGTGFWVVKEGDPHGLGRCPASRRAGQDLPCPRCLGRVLHPGSQFPGQGGPPARHALGHETGLQPSPFGGKPAETLRQCPSARHDSNKHGAEPRRRRPDSSPGSFPNGLPDVQPQAHDGARCGHSPRKPHRDAGEPEERGLVPDGGREKRGTGWDQSRENPEGQDPHPHPPQAGGAFPLAPPRPQKADRRADGRGKNQGEAQGGLGGVHAPGEGGRAGQQGDSGPRGSPAPATPLQGEHAQRGERSGPQGELGPLRAGKQGGVVGDQPGPLVQPVGSGEQGEPPPRKTGFVVRTGEAAHEGPDHEGQPVREPDKVRLFGHQDACTALLHEGFAGDGCTGGETPSGLCGVLPSLAKETGAERVENLPAPGQGDAVPGREGRAPRPSHLPVGLATAGPLPSGPGSVGEPIGSGEGFLETPGRVELFGSARSKKKPAARAAGLDIG